MSSPPYFPYWLSIFILVRPSTLLLISFFFLSSNVYINLLPCTQLVPFICPSVSFSLSLSLSLLQMAHLVPVKTHTSSMSGSQSLQDQTGSALSESVSVGSPRPEMPRQNSDPTSDTPGPPLRITGREERDRDRDRDRDRTAWLREEDMPPKVRELQTEMKLWYFIRSELYCLLGGKESPFKELEQNENQIYFDASTNRHDVK